MLLVIMVKARERERAQKLTKSWREEEEEEEEEDIIILGENAIDINFTRVIRK